MTEYFVLHHGRGTDGGFGDYSPPYWSEKPVEVNGRVVWFQTRGEAEIACEQLNEAASNAFYEAARANGRDMSYSGEFPEEYEVRRMFSPDNPSMSVEVAVKAITDSCLEDWKTDGWLDEDYWEDEDVEPPS